MTKIEEAEKTLAALEDKRKQLVQKATELADERQRISFAAHAGGDAKARKRLDEINAATVSHGSEMESIQAAIVEASRRVEAARHDAAIAADREAASELAEQWKLFVEHAKALDKALAGVTEHGHALEAILTQVNALGAASPSRAQLDSLGARALMSALQKTPWAREFSPIAPNERRTFSALVESWGASVRNNVAARLGNKREAA
jgi:predicted glycosyl hydrolase (DUF1957 family)